MLTALYGIGIFDAHFLPIHLIAMGFGELMASGHFENFFADASR